MWYPTTIYRIHNAAKSRCTGSPLGYNVSQRKPNHAQHRAQHYLSHPSQMHFVLTLLLTFITLTMATHPQTVTRVACFRFKSTVTAEQKSDRARAFLNLYEQHQDLILSMPKGGKPLNTPLNLTNVKRDSVWDTGFVVTFKVGLLYVTESLCMLMLWVERGGEVGV
jgi:hypothetical protein